MARVLVADDNQDAADSLALILSIDGHNVRRAYDGRHALELFAEFQPHVGILDVSMPNLDGNAVVRQVRDMALKIRPVLIALTGWGQEHDRVQALEAGFDYHFVKPLSPETFKSLLASLPIRTD